MKFNKLYTLLEGGNAIKSSVPIHQENVDATLNDIYKRLLPKLNISKNETASFGSTGKKLPGGSSGDIDLGLSIPALIKNNNLATAEDLWKFLVKTVKSFGYDYKESKGLGLISMGWTISNTDGKQKGETVQLDLMPVESIEWSSWAYHSPAEWESEWKGLYRNELIQSIAKYMDYKTLKKSLDKDGNEVDTEFENNFYDLNKGLIRSTKSRMGKKGLPVKTAKTIEKKFLTNNPTEAVHMIFGPKFSPNNILTWDDAYKAVTSKDFIYKKDLDKILKRTAEGIHKKGYPLPKEINKYL